MLHGATRWRKLYASMLLLVLVLAVGTLPHLAAHPNHDEAEVQREEQPLADFSFDSADHELDAEVLDDPLAYDADVASHDGKRWYAWLQFTPGRGDRIWVGRRQGDHWGVREPVGDSYGEFAAPTLTADSSGQLWLSYEMRRGDQWDVYLAAIDEQGRTGTARVVSTEDRADIRHTTAADRQGGLWIVWQSDVDGQFEIVARRATRDALGQLHQVTQNPDGDWHPHAGVDGQNQLYVVWDAFDGDNFDVCLRRMADGHWQPVVKVAGTPAFEGRAQIQVDRAGRVWLAWEEGGVNWGRPFRGINTELMRDQRGPLHRFRLLHVAMLQDDGRLAELARPLPMPSLTKAEERPGRQAGIERTGAFYERVRLCEDSEGRLWIAYRHYYTPWLGVAHRSHIEEGWGVYARCLTDDGWSPLYRARIGQGDGLQRLELAAHRDGIAAIWTTGRTHRTPSQRPRGLVTATWRAEQGAMPGASQIGSSRELPQAKLRGTGATLRRPTASVGGRQYQLFYGDLHRHTDLSLCRVPIDGTIDDAYRYASEVAELDFLGITDHSRDIAEGDPLSQLWWRSRKEVYRHQLANAAGFTFMPLYAYERSHSRTADHNVISLRPDMLRPHTYPIPQFWQELDRDTMTIPHQPIRRDTWAYQNDLLRPLVEMFQGCRDASIEQDVHEGLAKGFHLGFIASSDHMSTSASYACVWAERPTRESLFRAMQARRTFAATAKIQLVAHAGEHWMGEIVRAGELPPVSLDVQAEAPVRSVELIVDGKVQETVSPHAKHVTLERQLELAHGSYVYFHVVTADGNEAWSSPIWLEAP